MSMVFVLLPLSIILGGGALVLFLWALRNGQFDDLETGSHRPSRGFFECHQTRGNPGGSLS